MGKSRESIAAELEWDDNGIQLDTDVFADELWLNPGQAFQNSILRLVSMEICLIIHFLRNFVTSNEKSPKFSLKIVSGKI